MKTDMKDHKYKGFIIDLDIHPTGNGKEYPIKYRPGKFILGKDVAGDRKVKEYAYEKIYEIHPLSTIEEAINVTFQLACETIDKIERGDLDF